MVEDHEKERAELLVRLPHPTQQNPERLVLLSAQPRAQCCLWTLRTGEKRGV